MPFFVPGYVASPGWTDRVLRELLRYDSRPHLDGNTNRDYNTTPTKTTHYPTLTPSAGRCEMASALEALLSTNCFGFNHVWLPVNLYLTQFWQRFHRL